HFLDPQVVRDTLIATGTLEDLARDFIATAHRHTQDIFPVALAEFAELFLRYHPRVAHKDTPAQFPPAQIVLHLGHGADIDGITRKDPVPHWQAIARHCQAHNNWGGIAVKPRMTLGAALPDRAIADDPNDFGVLAVDVVVE